MQIRRALPADLDQLLALPADPDLATVGPERLREELAAGRMRWPWTWLVLDDDGALVGRALWWGRADSTSPLALECLHLLDRVPDRAGVAAELLRRAHAALAGPGTTTTPAPGPVEAQLVLPVGWRADPAVVRAVAWRVRAAAAAGLGEQLERLQVERAPGDAPPRSSGRWRFRSGTDEEFLALFERTAVGSLDVGTRRSLAVMSPAEQARDDLDFYLSCPGERDWWRIATGPDGDAVGFVVPSATPYARNVGHVGVLPEHRGRRVVDDLIAEATRRHAEQWARRITATTDATNTPMAAAFARTGYRVTEVRLLLSAPAGGAGQVPSSSTPA